MKQSECVYLWKLKFQHVHVLSDPLCWPQLPLSAPPNAADKTGSLLQPRFEDITLL